MDSQLWRAREKVTWRQSSSSSSIERRWQVGMEEQRGVWSSSERKVIGSVENYLENCADIKVDIEALARPIEPEKKVCLRYIFEALDERRQQYFPAF